MHVFLKEVFALSLSISSPFPLQLRPGHLSRCPWHLPTTLHGAQKLSDVSKSHLSRQMRARFKWKLDPATWFCNHHMKSAAINRRPAQRRPNSSPLIAKSFFFKKKIVSSGYHMWNETSKKAKWTSKKLYQAVPYLFDLKWEPTSPGRRLHSNLCFFNTNEDQSFPMHHSHLTDHSHWSVYVHGHEIQLHGSKTIYEEEPFVRWAERVSSLSPPCPPCPRVPSKFLC